MTESTGSIWKVLLLGVRSILRELLASLLAFLCFGFVVAMAIGFLGTVVLVSFWGIVLFVAILFEGIRIDERRKP